MATFKHNRLMIPGPVEVDPAVLEALGGPVEPHYGADWTKKQKLDAFFTCDGEKVE